MIKSRTTLFSCRTCIIIVRAPARDVRILRAIFANSTQHFNPFFYGTIASDNGALSRVSWLVGPLTLRVTIQLILSLRSYLPTTGGKKAIEYSTVTLTMKCHRTAECRMEKAGVDDICPQT